MRMVLQHGTVSRQISLWTRVCDVSLWLIILSQLVASAQALTQAELSSLRRETEDLFYHGYENYMKYAFPEDELKPLSCVPLTRDRENPANFETNDALGNYSLTLVDTLSTLAILASSPADEKTNKPLLLFQDGVKHLVEQYGDGSHGAQGHGQRARGFDVDSKVQVFETVIRGVGGLLSAHLFAVGELPIRGYNPPEQDVRYAQAWNKSMVKGKTSGIRWENGMFYDGQLVRLAYDLGKRLLPAFWTPTGLPYPRVNLKYGIPFYANSPNNYNPAEGQCDAQQQGTQEITETCSAGAGSLVLEFTVLSRLTGDYRFEDLAKRAFWAVWNRRTEIGLIGAGIDAETGLWIHSYTGIGAGIDSFFEYAFKSYVLLSNGARPSPVATAPEVDPRLLFTPLSVEEHSPAAFLRAWEDAHEAIVRHLRRVPNFQHPHYIQGDMLTGAARAFWIDALSAYYPGLLVLSGLTEEATEAHLLTTALWARFSALPERWNLVTGGVEGGLGWWVGRPEFIESNYYLAQATDDPWYQYVAEMTLRDIQRRCWTKCGWSGLQNVLTGEKSDRMESFFLGETAKYLFLTFDRTHPLNQLDLPFVFSTEGHPLLIPKSVGRPHTHSALARTGAITQTCPSRPASVPFTISATAARPDVYHAASLARLHLMPAKGEVGPFQGEYVIDHPSLKALETESRSNFTYFPWTLPRQLVPENATCSLLPTVPTVDIAFPAQKASGQSAPPLQRVREGIVINTLGGLRLSLVQDVPVFDERRESDGYRIYSINNVALGKDEKLFLSRETSYGSLSPTDPIFARVRDAGMLDIVLDTPVSSPTQAGKDQTNSTASSAPGLASHIEHNSLKVAWESLVAQLSNLMPDTTNLALPFVHLDQMRHVSQTHERRFLPATIPNGIGAAPIPDWHEVPLHQADQPPPENLHWTRVFAADDLCHEQLSPAVPRNHQVIVVRRGNCSFSQKLSKIPSVAQGRESLRLVIVVSYGIEDEDDLIRPLLDEAQKTISGLPRRNPLAMVMVGGGEATYQALQNARGIGIKRRYSVQSQGIPITNLFII